MSTGQSAVIVTPIVVLAVALLQATLKIIDWLIYLLKSATERILARLAAKSPHNGHTLQAGKNIFHKPVSRHYFNRISQVSSTAQERVTNTLGRVPTALVLTMMDPSWAATLQLVDKNR